MGLIKGALKNEKLCFSQKETLHEKIMENKMIKDLSPREEDWTLKVRVIRKTPREVYIKSERKTETMRLFLLDAEGSLIQATLFNEVISKFNDLLESGKSYIIHNGDVKSINTDYRNVNENIEISFTQTTEVEEVADQIPYTRTKPFVKFNEVEKFSTGLQSLDVAGVVLNVKSPFVATLKKQPSRTISKREVTLIDIMGTTIQLELWGDLASNEGDILESMVALKPAIVVLNVVPDTYGGVLKLTTTRVSVIEMNPQIPEIKELERSTEELLTIKGLDKILGPSKRMLESQVVTLENIIGSNVDNFYCSFIGTVVRIQNKNNPWYQNCNVCNGRVEPQGDSKTVFCRTCDKEDRSFTRHYMLKLVVTDGKKEAFVTLFDAAQTIIGCPVKKFADTLLSVQEKHSYVNYRNLMRSVDKEYKFLVKVDSKKRQDRAQDRIVVEEVCKNEKISKDEGTSSNKRKMEE